MSVISAEPRTALVHQVKVDRGRLTRRMYDQLDEVHVNDRRRWPACAPTDAATTQPSTWWAPTARTARWSRRPCAYSAPNTRRGTR